MAYFVVVTFDIHNGESEDYDCIKDKLQEHGLEKHLTTDKGKKVDLPFNTFAGEVEGTSQGTVRDSISAAVERAFKLCGVKGDVFVSVGGKWAWGLRHP